MSNQPTVPPRASNYPIQNQNAWSNNPNPNQRPPSGGPMFNNRPPVTPQRTNASQVPNQFAMQGAQRPPAQGMRGSPPIPQRSTNNPQYPPPTVQSTNPSGLPIQQFSQQPPTASNNFNNMPPPRQTTPPPPPRSNMSSPNGNISPPPRSNMSSPRSNMSPPPRSNMSSPPPRSNMSSPPPRSNMSPPSRGNSSTSAGHSNNIQVNSTSQNVQQRRNNSQKDLPKPPQPIKKSQSSLSRSASNLKTKFVGMVSRSLSRKGTTNINKQEKSRRLSSYGGMNIHHAYRNSLMAKPVFDSKLLLKPQNPNFIISLGIIIMIASVSLAIAFVALRNGGLTESKIHDISSEDSYGFIFFSMFMILIGLTGYVAYHKKWTSLLITYSVFIIFAFIVQIIIILLFLNIYIHPLVQMRYKWIDVLTDAEKQAIQEGYQCCGYLSVVDHGLTTSQCMPDTGSTTLSIKTAKSMTNSISYLDPNLLANLTKRQVAGDAGGVGVDNVGGAGADNAGGVGADNAGGLGADNAGAAAGVAGGAMGGAGGAAGGAGGVAGGAGGAGATVGAANPVDDLKNLYKTKDPSTYTEDDIKDEGCARIIVSAIKSGLLQYILIEIFMAILFVVAFYFSVVHFKEQLKIEKEVDTACATFG